MNFMEDILGFSVDTKKLLIVFIVLAVLISIPFLLGGDGLPDADRSAAERQFEQQQQEFEEQVTDGDVEPVLTQDIRVTADGFEPQFALIEFVPATSPDERGVARVRVTNTDSVTRTIVLGENDVREMPPGKEFTLTFGQPTTIEITDHEDPDIRGKMFICEEDAIEQGTCP